jgi:hypothetical protein
VSPGDVIVNNEYYPIMALPAAICSLDPAFDNGWPFVPGKNPNPHTYMRHNFPFGVWDPPIFVPFVATVAAATLAPVVRTEAQQIPAPRPGATSGSSYA